MEFMGTPKPEKRQTYGPRVWVKFDAAQRYGTADETKVYDQLKKLSCWGGEDKSMTTGDGLLCILSFEFPFIPVRADDTLQTAMRRKAYEKAFLVLKDGGYTETTDHDSFFEGYR